MQKLVYACVLFFHCWFSNAQDFIPYYHIINEARWMFFKENYSIADSLFRKAFSTVKDVHPEHLFEAAKNAEANNDPESCYRYCRASLEKGMHWQKIEELQNFVSTAWFAKLTEQKDQLHAVLLKNTDRDWCNLIDSIFVRDQYNRRENQDKRDILDSINKQVIKDIIRKNGRMPGLRELGYDGVAKLNIILRHVEVRYVLDTLARILIKQAIQGDFPPEVPTTMVDRACFIDAERPYAFTREVFGNALSFGGENILVLVRNRECVNRLRSAVGLMSIERMVEMRRLKVYDEEEFKEKFKDYFMDPPPRRPVIINCDISEI